MEARASPETHESTFLDPSQKKSYSAMGETNEKP